MPLREIISGQERMDDVPEEQEPPSSGDDDDDDDDDNDEEQGSTAEGDGDDQQQTEDDPQQQSPPLSADRLPPRTNIPLREREHSYLPGASHPLFPDSLRERQKVVVHHNRVSRWNRQRQRRQPNQQQQQQQQQQQHYQQQTAYTTGVPLSLSLSLSLSVHPINDHVEHDNGSSSSSSSDGGFEYVADDDKSHLTELAVLELPSVVLFPGSTIPIRLTDRHWTEYLGRQIEASRSLQSLSALHSSSSQHSGQHEQKQQQSLAEPVRLGILTRVATPQEDRTTAVRNRRQSWTRQGMGSNRLRRLSEQVVLELGNLVESEDEAEEQEENDNTQSNNGTDTTDATDNNSNNNNSERRRSRPGLPPSAEERRENRRQRRAEVNTGSARKERHPYLGRIGTIAFVTYTHGDAAMDDNDTDNAITVTGRDEQGSSRVWRSPREEGQLVVTALGTSRFRIDSFAHEEDADIMNRHPEYARMHSMGVKTFLVEELEDEPLSLPPLHLRHCLEPNAPTGRYRQRHNRLIQRLSCVSPYPSFVYQLAWPWKMVADILEAVKRVSTFAGLSQSLPSLDDDAGDNDTHRFLEPLTFSFWMACNMPMSEEEKLCLLEMHSTVERLQYIRQKIGDEERIESFIHCKSCGIPLSRAAFMFSVVGAEGTTGAYVNEYGCIHQTITVREVCEAEVWFQGHAETKDSWFEGYSWTVMNCVFCGSHLGWKFQRVDRREDPTPDRPDQFYGLSAASVATQGASTSLNRRSLR